MGLSICLMIINDRSWLAKRCLSLIYPYDPVIKTLKKQEGHPLIQ
jgi:hypothetical protein